MHQLDIIRYMLPLQYNHNYSNGLPGFRQGYQTGQNNHGLIVNVVDCHPVSVFLKMTFMIHPVDKIL